MDGERPRLCRSRPLFLRPGRGETQTPARALCVLGDDPHLLRESDIPGFDKGVEEGGVEVGAKVCVCVAIAGCGALLLLPPEIVWGIFVLGDGL